MTGCPERIPVLLCGRQTSQGKSGSRQPGEEGTADSGGQKTVPLTASAGRTAPRVCGRLSSEVGEGAAVGGGSRAGAEVHASCGALLCFLVVTPCFCSTSQDCSFTFINVTDWCPSPPINKRLLEGRDGQFFSLGALYTAGTQLMFAEWMDEQSSGLECDYRKKKPYEHTS